MRLYGRGPGVSAERFDDLSSPDALARWVAPLRHLADDADQVHVLTNNHTCEAALLTARVLATLVVEA